MKKLLTSIALFFFATAVNAASPHVIFKTSLGEIEFELAQDKAPISVTNFLKYVDSGQYKGELFHRVIPGFVAQGGGFQLDLIQRATGPAIKNEAGNGLKNLRGTVAMARTSVVDSATAQFFINLADNNFLDHIDNTTAGYGYAVFGKVVRGMEVVDAMAKQPTMTYGPFADLPVTPILIQDAYGVMAASVTATGALTNQTLKVDFSPASADVGRTGSVFVAAALPSGDIFTLSGAGWTRFDPSQPAAYASGSLQSASFNLVDSLNLTSLMGTSIFVGYGMGDTPNASLAELVAKSRLVTPYTIK